MFPRLLLAIALVATASLASPIGLLVTLRHKAIAKAELERVFWNVADPKHREFGRFRSPSELAVLVGGSDDALARTTAWLHSIGARHVQVIGTRDALVADWLKNESQFQFQQQQGQALDHPVLTAPTIPAALTDVVERVMLLRPASASSSSSSSTPRFRMYPSPSSVSSTSSSPLKVGKAGFELPAQRAAYEIPANLTGSHPDNLQMVWGPGTFGFMANDLKQFYSLYCPECNAAAVGFDRQSLWNGTFGDNTYEGSLDTEYISGMTRNVRTLVSNTNLTMSTEEGDGFGAAFLLFLSSLTSRTLPGSGGGSEDLPLVLSLSLGSLSFASCDLLCQTVAGNNWGYSYADCWSYMQQQRQVCMFASADEVTRIETELQKLALLGVTVLAASGDGGSHFSFEPFQPLNGTDTLAPKLNQIICEQYNMPTFPSDSPYVLSVGGTDFAGISMGPTCTSDQPCGWSGSGGGFSWETPLGSISWQSAVTQKYLQNAQAYQIMTVDGSYNGTNRGYPDVAMLAAIGIPLCAGGRCFGSGGTSASAPTMAGMLSLINDDRLSRGLGPLGYINKRLYALMADPQVYAECFADIGWTADEVTAGGWDCQGYSTCTGCGMGFPATPGWDPQTGFGQPKFPGWLKYFGN